MAERPHGDDDKVVARAKSHDELVARAQGGDRRAVARLLRDHDEVMRRYVYAMVRDRTAMDDILQDAYVKAFRALPGFRGDAAFATWLRAIVHHTTLDHLRRRRATVPLDEIAEPLDTGAGPEELTVNTAVVRRALAELSTDHRATILLADCEQLPYDQIADLLGISSGTVASRLHRARVQMRRSLDRMTGGEDR